MRAVWTVARTELSDGEPVGGFYLYPLDVLDVWTETSADGQRIRVVRWTDDRKGIRRIFIARGRLELES